MRLVLVTSGERCFEIDNIEREVACSEPILDPGNRHLFQNCRETDWHTVGSLDYELDHEVLRARNPACTVRPPGRVGIPWEHQWVDFT